MASFCLHRSAPGIIQDNISSDSTVGFTVSQVLKPFKMNLSSSFEQKALLKATLTSAGTTFSALFLQQPTPGRLSRRQLLCSD